jgi:hypothetical protein
MNKLHYAIAITAAAALSPAGAWASPDNDIRPVAQCDTLPPIEILANTDAREVCSEMIRILNGATVADLVLFSKVAYVPSRKGYEPGKYADITHDLVEIIRLRGLAYNEPRWELTIEIV